MNTNIVALRAPAGRAAPPPASDSPVVNSRRLPRLQRHHALLAALLLLTGIAYIWDLSSSGYANSFYAAAVQAGTKSWKAFFFGSLDSSSFITVDKPPASLWVMALSGRIFGFSSWSMLIPQALEGVAAVALLYSAVRRWFGTGAGLAAGALLAMTPVAALMFRFNNPDALLVLLLVAGAYCLVRALEHAGTKWVLAAGTMIGFAFLAKMMQAFLVLPAFGLVYMVAAPAPLRRRTWQTLAGFGAVLVSAGWWVAIVALWPAGSRPMIDGSPDNNIFNLIFGYNGLGRIFGASGVGGTNTGGGANFGGSTGALRLFNDLMGGQASWLLPAALLALAGGLIATRRAPRTDRTRAALLLWGGWLVVTAAVFSFSSGVIHTYYTVALAPAIAALVAIGGWQLWTHRDRLAARIGYAVAVLATAGWSYILLDRTPSWEPWLRVVVVAAAIAGLAILAALAVRPRLGRTLAIAGVTLTILGSVAGPVAYAMDTITSAHTGSVPTAGPATSGGGFGAPGGGGFAGAGGLGRGARGLPGGGASSGASGVAQLFGSAGGARPGGARVPGTGGTGGPSGTGGTGGGPGGGQVTVNAALKRALQANSGSYRWAAAVSGSQSAASLELATGGTPVMAIGGFNNQGGLITLQQFKQYVDKGEIHYYIAGGGGAGGGPGGGGQGGSTTAITAWVESHFTKVTIGGETLYNLTESAS
ncbi:MAG TPA: glycosyltransferase family 39 protein [Solirubrobacteraceae bacterium]|nr:glycosyltransferase family 39 protein [Solirubrobacteraceae bacterium]